MSDELRRFYMKAADEVSAPLRTRIRQLEDERTRIRGLAEKWRKECAGHDVPLFCDTCLCRQELEELLGELAE